MAMLRLRMRTSRFSLFFFFFFFFFFVVVSCHRNTIVQREGFGGFKPSDSMFHYHSHDSGTERPIIGIMTVPTPQGLKKQYPWAQSFIPASYVKFVEMSGARIAPILIDRDSHYYDQLISSVNGLLLPGGGVTLEGSDYEKTATYLLNQAVQFNKNNDPFPVWGTCLGFEMLATFLSANKSSSVLTQCSAEDLAMPLILSADYKTSRMFSYKIADDVLSALRTEPVTYNFHYKCVTPEAVNNTGLNKLIHVLSTNKDAKGLQFVSTFEHLQYPFFGVQWHPEKNPFEWTKKLENIPHTDDAIKVSQFFGDVFVSEARKSSHHFYNEDVESKALINNFHSFFTVNANTTFFEVYLFHNTTSNMH